MFKKTVFAVALVLSMVLALVPVAAFASYPETEFAAADLRCESGETAAKAEGEAIEVSKLDLTDHGPNPYSTNLSRLAGKNPNYRTAIWTGQELQLTVMSIPKKGEVGLEVHPETDQFFYVAEGSGIVLMGPAQNSLNYTMPLEKGSAIFIPLGTWHNIVNKGCGNLKLFTVYAPPHHPHGTVQKTKAIADAEQTRVN